jgi:acyl carrier protein
MTKIPSSPAEALVHDLLASHLQVETESVENADSLSELGLDPLDLVIVVLKMEQLCGGDSFFPLVALADARTVGDFVALADRWLQEEAPPSAVATSACRRGSAA